MKRRFKLSISVILIFVISLTNVLAVFPEDNGIQDGNEVIVEENAPEEVVEATPEPIMGVTPR